MKSYGRLTMNTILRVLSIAYLAVTSMTVLIMLVETFEQFDEKYFPSFILAQKFALPIILTSLAFVFLVFFEPERLRVKKTIAVMKFAMLVTSGLFTVFLTTVNLNLTSGSSIVMYLLQWIVTLAVTIQFFRLKNIKAAP